MGRRYITHYLWARDEMNCDALMVSAKLGSGLRLNQFGRNSLRHFRPGKSHIGGITLRLFSLAVVMSCNECNECWYTSTVLLSLVHFEGYLQGLPLKQNCYSWTTNCKICNEQFLVSFILNDNNSRDTFLQIENIDLYGLVMNISIKFFSESKT